MQSDPRQDGAMDATTWDPQDVTGLLGEVAVRGAPAQQEHARSLLARLAAGPADAAAVEEALLLVDAFRNDPYLWR